MIRYLHGKRLFMLILSAICMAVMIPAVPSFAYINRGNVEISDPGTETLKVGETTTMTITPAVEEHYPGCGMAECPESCGEKNCIEIVNGQKECCCQGTVFNTYYAEVSPHSSNENVATVSYDNRGNLTITGVGEGTAQISVCADFREYTGASKTVNINVTASDSKTEPDVPDQPAVPEEPDQPANPDHPAEPAVPEDPETDGNSHTDHGGTPDVQPQTYNIAFGSIKGGTVTADKKDCRAGEKVTLVPVAYEGYSFEGLMVKDSSGKEVTVSHSDSGYCFVMPESDVSVTAVFKKKEAGSPAADKDLPFTDISADRWSRAAVQYVYNKGLFNGTSSSEFSPESLMNRGMTVSVLYRMDGSPASGGRLRFSDVPSDAYYMDAVRWADENGIANGMSETSFDPDNSLTREQLAAFLYRYAGYKKFDISASPVPETYSDRGDISSYAEDAMNWAVSNGIITGMTPSELKPQGSATREQVAAMLMRFMQKYGSGQPVK